MPEKIILEEDSTFVYYVDIEKGVVAAVMEEPIEEAKSYIVKLGHALEETEICIPQANLILEKYLCSPIRAKATCHEEDEFDLEISDEALENIKTVSDIVKFIEEH